MALLTESDHAFLDALRGGETINDYARRNNYTLSWGVWKSRDVRRKLGAKTIGEAVLMVEADGISRKDFEQLAGLVGSLTTAVEDLAKRPQAAEAKETVRERELSVKELAEKLGLTPEDVERVKGEKEYERFKTMQDRLDAERAEGEEEEEENGAGKGIGGVIRDGLGGIRNVKPQ